MQLVTYLAFDGTCAAAFTHYARVLGGEIQAMKTYGNSPEVASDPDMADRVMHARLKVGANLLMGGDGPCGGGPMPKPQGFCAHVMIEDPGEAERIFRDLGEGGTVTMPIGETFWARRFGMLTDRFGVPWMVNCEIDMSAPALDIAPFEIARTYDVSRARLWQAFATQSELGQWWGPKGIDIVAPKLDLTTGGVFHYGMKTPDGTVMWGRFRFREVVAGERVDFVSSFSDAHGGLTRHPGAPEWPIEFLTTFRFEDAGKGRSTFAISAVPLHPNATELATFEGGRASLTNGWGGTLDRLAAHLASV